MCVICMGSYYDHECMLQVYNTVPLLVQAYLFKYDSTHGQFQGSVETKEGKLIINGNEIAVYAL